ncbi:MAG: hypothetical protein DRH08_12415 [Deltaproteobacteria bacterium]|nr:MAG: hypothetical protein DRH08_12415 [Deltaproteobacteria bacterium]
MARKAKLTLAKLTEMFPGDAVCAFCGETNDHWDKAGFFYLSTRPGMTMEELQPACKSCDEGEPGALHLAINGPGDGNR